MRNRLFLVSMLAGLPFVARSATLPPMMTTPNRTDPAAAPQGAFGKVDSAMAEAARALKDLKNCEKLAATLKSDLAAKEKQLKTEYGTPPASFGTLLQMKRKRLDRQERRCIELVPQPAQLYSQAHELLRQVEPKNMPGVSARFKKIDAARASYNAMITASKRRRR